jgi:uncharacterized repeat protein (TIGR03803 family)
MRASYLASILSKIFLVATLVAIGGASAPSVTEKVLHAFSGAPDGARPVAGLVGSSDGNLFGTTSGGGKGFGIVFELTGTYDKKEKVLYRFSGGSDGAVPKAGLVIDSVGNLYGTTSGGGKNNLGVVFELTKSSNYMHEIVLHSFGGSDGAVPKAGLIFDGSGKGNLYGTTSAGGKNKLGVVFELTKSSNYTHEIVLHSFSGSDGAVPVAGLVIDSAGNLYGTTSGGGSKGFGVVFSLTGKGTLTVLHSFSGGSDGAAPRAGLIFDKPGNLYGTTSKGGNSGLGVAFELIKKGGYKKEAVLHSFAGGTDGADPEAGLAFGLKQINLYGTTAGGGKGFGVVFKLTGSDHTTEKVQYRFTGGTDGGVPLAGLIFTPPVADEPAEDEPALPPKGGCTYGCGTTISGGDLTCHAPNGCGVVFKLFSK